MSIKVKVLPVYQGDCILLYFNDESHCIMIDTGTKRSYSKGVLRSEIEKLNTVDLLILTHTDEDHIGGILKYYEDKSKKDNIFKEVWFNSGSLIKDKLGLKNNQLLEIPLNDPDDLEISIKQGITLEKELISRNILHEDIIIAGDHHNIQSGNIKILSPEIGDLRTFCSFWEIEQNKNLEMTRANDYGQIIGDLVKVKYKEKGTIANKTSIAFIFEFAKLRILLMGDAYPSVIEMNIRKLGYDETNKLKLNVVKISHHGSIYGISPELLNIIDCNDFIISTNGSNGLPFKECLSRIITHKKDKINLYFNYKNEIIENIFFEHEYEDYNFEVKYLNEDNNYTINISE